MARKVWRMVGISAVVGTMCVGGCSAMDEANRRAAANTVVNVRPTASLDLDEMRAAMRPGSSTVRGVALARSTSNPLTLKWFRDKHFAAGKELVVLPATPYVLEWQRLRERANERTRVEMAPEVWQLARRVPTDNYGRFEVTGLSPGRYWMGCDMSWGETRNYKTATGQVEASDGSSATIYQHGSYVKGYSDVIEAVVEVKGDGAVIEVEVTN